MNDCGKVYLVGAGIGSEKYITVKGKEVLQKADVVVYDRLLNMNLIEAYNDEIEYINVGKVASNHTFTQDEINDILLQKSKEGKCVVRLKGGDPYVFGRGGEEAEYLIDRGIDVEVVPGVTSGVAGLCFAGIPITHRAYGSSLHMITGHRKNESDLDYDTLSKLEGTMVFYMGLNNIENISKGLIAKGKDPDTACAVISHGGYPDQKVIVSNLANITYDVRVNNIKSPSLIVVGNVVKLREKLNFYEKKPLFGKNIVVTRARSQSSALSQELSDLGANVIEIPTIKIKPINADKLKAEQDNICDYTHLIFTSPNGVNIFMKSILEHRDVRALGNVKIFAIGDGTANELMKYSIKADFVPSKFVSETLLEEIEDKFKKGDKIMMPRALKARKFLKEKFLDICELVEVPIYDTLTEDISEDDKNILKNTNIDYITFTSSSTVDNFVKLIDDEILCNIKKSKIVSIGPITSKTVESYGLKVYREANIHNIKNLIKTMTDEETQL